MKIVGNTVGTSLPKPDLRQTDPKKGDYVKGKDEITESVNEALAQGNYATEEFVTNKIAEAELGGKEVDLSGYAQKSELPTKVSQLQNDSGYLTEHQDLSAYALKTELPTVPVQSVNGKTGAVNLSASDVGAMPNGTKIPSKTSDLTNDSGFITGYAETDPTVPAWAKATTKPSYSKSEVGLGNVDNVKQYSASNPPPYPVTSVNGKTGAVTLDASAVGARPSTWMPSASDVGALPSSTTIPTKTSQLTNDSGFIKSYTETDPTVPSWAKASSKPSYSKSEVGLGNVDNVKQYSASNPPPYPVASVNGKTGAVTVSVPTKVSQLQNDAGYLTEISKEEIVQQVIAALGTPVFGRLEANNKIVFTSPSLADGIYTCWFENENGKESEIGELVNVNYTNQIPISTDTNGSVYNGTGYKVNTRGNSSGAPADFDPKISGLTPFFTGFIPVKQGDVIRLKNCFIEVSNNLDYNTNGGSDYWGIRSGLYNSSKAKVDNVSWGQLIDGDQTRFSNYTKVNGKVTEFTIAYSGVAFVRLTLATNGNPADAILTVNEEIN